MKASRDTSTSVVRLAVLAGFWAVACTPASNNQTGAGSASGGARTGGNTGTGGSGSGGSNAGGSGSGGSNAGGSGSGGSNSGGSSSGGSGDGGSNSGGSNAGGSSSGGSNSGGSNSGGSSSGGSSSGGSSSGGSSSGGSSSGGSSSGGSSSGGSSSGGSSSGGSSSGGSSAGGSSAGGSAAGGTTSTSGCSTVWDWEGTTTDSWAADTDVTLSVSTTQKVTGTQSLKATIPALTSVAADDAGTAATTTVRGISITPPAAASNLWPGATVTVKVLIPTGTTGLWIHVYMQSNNWVNWNDTTVGTITPGTWSTLTFTVPAASAIFPGGINRFGVQLGVSGGGTFAGGDIFIDSITVCGGTQTCSGTDTGSFDFETAGSTDGWAFKGDTSVTDTVVTQSTTQHYGTTGSGSLKVAMTAVPAAPAPPATGWTSRQVELANPKAYCGQTITFHVKADNVTGLNVQPYAMANGWGWFAGNGVTLTDTTSWTEIKYTLPATITFQGLQAFGLQLSNTVSTGTYTGNVYIDGISWQ